MVQIKRIYDEAGPDDGYRVLVDRLWPRGLSKAKAGLDLWLKEVAPSNELRQWFHTMGAANNFAEFSIKYQAELANNPAVGELRDVIRNHHVVTLLFGSRELEFNHAGVLREFLTRDSKVN